MASCAAIVPVAGYNNPMTHPEPSMPVATPRRFPWRWLVQYRLRSLLILTTIVAIALGWWSHKARQQQAAVAALRKAGAEIQYDPSFPWISENDKGGTKQPPSWPNWLLDVVGEDYFARVHRIDCRNTQITDTDLQHIQGLTALQRLNLVGTAVTDSGLQHLAGLTQLRELWLDNTGVTDAGLEYLTALTSLRVLHLDETRVGNRAGQLTSRLSNLEELWIESSDISDFRLSGLPQLSNLSCTPDKTLRVIALHDLPSLTTSIRCDANAIELSNLPLVREISVYSCAHFRSHGFIALEAFFATECPFEVEVLEQLRDCDKLRILHLAGSRVTDAGMKHLANKAHLEKLNLSGTSVSDIGVKCLKELPKLAELNLADTETAVTDASIGVFIGMPALRTLIISGTDVSAAGIRQLKERRPDLRVIHSDPP